MHLCCVQGPICSRGKSCDLTSRQVGVEVHEEGLAETNTSGFVCTPAPSSGTQYLRCVLGSHLPPKYPVISLVVRCTWKSMRSRVLDGTSTKTAQFLLAPDAVLSGLHSETHTLSIRVPLAAQIASNLTTGQMCVKIHQQQGVG